MPIHPVISLFESRAEVLDATGDGRELDDAIAQFAAWIELASDHLTENDLVVLSDIGAMMYRHGLLHRGKPST
jgi:hypothetical protein